LVIANDTAAVSGQLPAESLRPPEHGRTATHDQQNGRVGRIAERLSGDVEPIVSDEAFARSLLLRR